jgi:hypothetical protein
MSLTSFGLIAFVIQLHAFPDVRIATDHFIIEYETSVDVSSTQLVSEILETSFSFLVSKKHLPEVTRHIKVHLYGSTSKYVQSNGVKWWLGAVYRGGVIHVQPPAVLQNRGILRTTLSHELVHALFDEARRNGLPDWLNESVAVNSSGEMLHMKIPTVIDVHSFQDLETKTKNVRRRSGLDDTYYLCGLTMEFLLREYGPTKVDSLIKQFDGPNNSVKAVSQAFGEDFHSVEKKWLRYLTSRVH